MGWEGRRKGKLWPGTNAREKNKEEEENETPTLRPGPLPPSPASSCALSPWHLALNGLNIPHTQIIFWDKTNKETNKHFYIQNLTTVTPVFQFLCYRVFKNRTKKGSRRGSIVSY